MSAARLDLASIGKGGRGGNRLLNRQNFLIALLCLLLLITTILQGQDEEEVVYNPNSVGPFGLRGLLLWLDELGYDVEQTGADAFPLERFGSPADANGVDMLFVYPNVLPYSDVEAQAVRQWVEAGGTLVLIGPSAVDRALEETFGVYLAEQTLSFSSEIQAQPLLPDREEDDRGIGTGDHLVIADAPVAVSVLIQERTAEDSDSGEGGVLSEPEQIRTATVAVQQIDSGVVWHLAPEHSFTNILLRDEQEAGLLPPLLRTVPAGGRILLDTYHLFSSPAEEGQIGSVQAWFYQTASGRAVIFALLTIFGYLLLQGRRLGPPLPSTEATRRREAAEFVTAMAGLQQRSQQKATVALYHRQRLRALLGRKYSISGTLSDDDFAEQLAQTMAGPSEEQLGTIRKLLRTLSNEPNEATLIDAVGQIDEIVDG